MPSYIVLMNFTDQGAATVKDAPSRLEGAKQAITAFGAEMKVVYFTMGQYDIAGVVEAPDDETMSKISLAMGSQGNIRTTTTRAFTEDEFRNIIASLP